MITLPTRAGRIVLTEADQSARCATGCRTLGGGMVYKDGQDDPVGVIPICGTCLAESIVDRIDKIAGRG